MNLTDILEDREKNPDLIDLEKHYPFRTYNFKYFNPLTGQGPKGFSKEVDEIARRARKILEEESENEINQLVDIASWLITHNKLAKFIATETMKSVSKTNNEELEGYTYEGIEYQAPDTICSMARLMQHASSIFTLEDFEYKDIKYTTWPKLFAAMSLSNIAHLCKIYYEQEKPELISIHRAAKYNLMVRTIVRAMEAVAYAENFREIDSIKDKEKLVKKKAAIARHANTSALINEFIEYYESGGFPNMSVAARKFYNNLPEKKQKLLSRDNAIRTLTENLSKYLRQTTKDSNA